jgi:hypothetical protein
MPHGCGAFVALKYSDRGLLQKVYRTSPDLTHIICASVLKRAARAQQVRTVYGKLSFFERCESGFSGYRSTIIAGMSKIRRVIDTSSKRMITG